MGFTSGPIYLNVFDYGAKGDGVTDDTSAIQSAIDAAFTIRSSGAQNVVVVEFPPAPYLCNGSLSVYDTSYGPGYYYGDIPVILAGSSRGPYCLTNDINGVRFDIPMFLITSTAGPFMRIGTSVIGYLNSNVTIQDLHFHYTGNQDPSTTPTIYPATIDISSSTDIKVRRCSTDNAGQFIVAGYDQVTGGYSTVGRLTFEELNIGAFETGISVDTALDVVRINNVHIWPFWDAANGASTTSEYDLYAAQHLTGLLFGRADNVMVLNTFVYGAQVGLTAGYTNNPSPPGSIATSYGQATNFSTDTCQIGFWLQDTQGKGWTFTNYVSDGGSISYGGTTVASAWAGYAGNPFTGTGGYGQVIGGSIGGAYTSSQSLTPYDVLNTASYTSPTFTGPFGVDTSSSPVSNLRVVWVDAYD